MNFKDKSVCVVDSGMYVSTALRLARDFGKVYYHSPWIKTCPTLSRRAPGMGFKEIERVDYLWSIKNKVDLWVFPWIFFWDLQLELEAQGKRVWGARTGEFLELDRELFKKETRKAGLPFSGWEKVIGITALEDSLKANENVWVKTAPCIRGDGETWHSDNYELSQPQLELLRHRWGPLAETVEFIVEEAIDDAVEDGFDGYNIDGQWPDHGFEGLEIKDCGVVIAYKPWEEISAPVRISNEKLSAYLKQCRYRGPWGTEIRVDKRGLPHFNDPTCRLSFPPGQAIEEGLENLAEIMWFGAEGKLIQPVCRYKYLVQVQIYSDFPEWQPFQIEKGMERWVKVSAATSDGKQVYAVPDMIYPGEHDPIVGCVIGCGNTIEEMLKDIKKKSEAFKSFKMNVRLDAIPKAFAELSKGESRGVVWAKDIPTPQQIEKWLA